MKRHLLTKKFIKILLYINCIVLPIHLLFETGMYYSEPHLFRMSIVAIHYFFMSGTLLAFTIVIVLPFLYRALQNDRLKNKHVIRVGILIAINLISFIVLLVSFIKYSRTNDPIFMFFFTYFGSYFVVQIINLIYLLKIFFILKSATTSIIVEEEEKSRKS